MLIVFMDAYIKLYSRDDICIIFGSACICWNITNFKIG